MRTKWSRDKLLRQLGSLLRDTSDNKDKRQVLATINQVISKDVSNTLVPISIDVRLIPVCCKCHVQYTKPCLCMPDKPTDDTSIQAMDVLDNHGTHDVHATTQDSVASDH